VIGARSGSQVVLALGAQRRLRGPTSATTTPASRVAIRTYRRAPQSDSRSRLRTHVVRSAV